MKITRFARGYRLRLTDAEFDAISLLVRCGQEHLAHHPMATVEAAHLSTKAQKHLRGRFGLVKGMPWAARPAFRVDDDRRPVMKRAAGNSGRPLPATTKETAVG